MRKFPSLFFIGLICIQFTAFSAESSYDARFGTNTRTQANYFQNMARDWGRGLTNLVTCPLEIPLTIKKYHNDGTGVAGVRYIAGLTDGIIRTVNRAASGAWDLVVSFVPGDQEGAIMKPATLFEKEPAQD